jgi:DNA-binding Lrp family transcriptional regulator
LYFEVFSLENIFADIDAVSTSSAVTEDSVKLKRSAFIFITAESDSSHAALEELRKIDAVEEVYLARGAYDIVAKVTGESLDHVREVVQRQIRNLDTIKSTLTLTVI